MNYTSKQNQITCHGNESMNSFQLKSEISDSELLTLQMYFSPIYKSGGKAN